MDLRIPLDELAGTMRQALLPRGFRPDRAAACATLFAAADLDGVRSHGAARFPRFCASLAQGHVDPAAEPVLEEALGAWERWDGRAGPGNLNAAAAVDRAVAIARERGIGLVALRNTNHWMRGGAFGLRAADSGCAAILWTNTTPNLPAWGAREAVIGNNPLVIAAPREGGHVLLDTAMSQFSWGKLEGYAARGEALPVDGGYDAEGRLTRDAAAIVATRRALPIGFWKGSGLSILLDILAALLSGGDAVGDIGRRGVECGLSQVFLAIDLSKRDGGAVRDTVEGILTSLHEAAPAEEGVAVRFPGERTAATRAENLLRGVPVDEELWRKLGELAAG
jgi:3-dehydro-L-gulonate 2-dehydrogenase